MDRPVAPFVLALDEGASRETPVFLRIARALSDDMRRGRLKPGARLPGSRTLAGTLGVHRNTVLAAFRELTAEGWIAARQGGGTFVSSELPTTAPRRFSKSPVSFKAPQPGFSLEGANVRPPPREPHVQGRLLMYGGVPDVRLMPGVALAREFRRLLRTSSRTLGYGDPRGDEALRAAIAGMLSSRRGLAVDGDDVLITRGSQMALWLAARVILQPGSVVAVENIGYRPAWEAFQEVGATTQPVRVDEHGLDVDALEALCKKTRISAVYVTPHHQYPTTVELSASRRLKLLALAERERFAIFEDDYDHEFHYEGRPILPLASADRAGVVVYIGTLSKVLAPGLRLGYLVAPRPVLERALGVRAFLDRQGDHVTERAVTGLIEDGELERHLRRTRREYLTRRDCCVAALKKTFDDRLSFRIPHGGMALWAKVRPGLDPETWLARAHEHGVSFHAGRQFDWDGKTLPFVRLGFAGLDERELVEAVKRLERAARAARAPTSK